MAIVVYQLLYSSAPTGFTPSTVQQALRVKWRVFGVFVCFDLYFVNYRSWQAEILQECAEGCIQGDLQKKIRCIFILWFCRGGFWS